MRLAQRIISTGFATAAIAAASMPALSGTVWPDVDFEWYANVGKPTSQARVVRQGETVSTRPDGRVVVPDPDDFRGADAATPHFAPVPDSTSSFERRDSTIAPSLPDAQGEAPTLPATGSNRR